MKTPQTGRSDGWTGPPPFVGHDALLERMHRMADQAARGRGRLLFVLGDPGSGKHRLVGRLLDLNDGRDRPMAVVQGRAGATPNIWESARRRVTRRRRIRRFLASTIPEWISAVPVVGNVIAATIRTVQVIRSRDDPEPDPAEEARRRAGTIAAVDELIEEAGGPTILVIREFEHAGDDDLAGAFHCLRALSGHPILVVATVALERGRPPAPVLDLVREAERYDAGETVQLPAWSWSDAPVAENPGPSDDQELEDRLQGLAPDDREFLAVATRDGPTFTSEEIRLRSGASELEVQDRLARLERERWVRFVDIQETDEDLVDSYEVAVQGLVEALRHWSRDP